MDIYIISSMLRKQFIYLLHAESLVNAAHKPESSLFLSVLLMLMGKELVCCCRYIY